MSDALVPISGLTSMGGADAEGTDVLVIVDVTDLSQAATGSTKKMTLAAFRTMLLAATVAGFAATDVLNALTVNATSVVASGSVSGGAASFTTGAFSGDFTVGASKFTVAAASGNTAIAGTTTLSALATAQQYLPYVASTGVLTSTSIRTDGTNYSIGTTLTSEATWLMQRQETNPTTNSTVMQLFGKPIFNANSATNFFASRTNAYPLVGAGYTNTGEVRATWSVALRNYIAAGSDDNGTLSYLFGHNVEYGHFNINTSATPVTTTVYGIHLRPFCYHGTITNLYDIYIADDREPFTGTVTNHFGVYAPSTTAKHYLQGNLYLGAVPATSAWKLSVTGETLFGATTANSFYTSANSLNAQHGTNANGTFWLNFAGYNGGTTQFRDLKIGDGKNTMIASFIGATGAATFAGALAIAGALTGVTSIAISGAATTQAAGVLSLGNTTQATVGAAGGASALPATPTGYLKTYIGATQYVIPYYAQA